VVGTHPIPMKQFTNHKKMSFWEKSGIKEFAPKLFKEMEVTMINYN